jgi:hypothetical protein
MGLAEPEKPELTDEQASINPPKGDSNPRAPDIHDQSTESQAASSPVIVPQRISKMLRSRGVGEGTLFNVEITSQSVDQKLVMKLPQFAMLDVDQVRTDSRVEICLRQYKINTLYAPSAGLLTRASLFQVAFQEPVQVIMRDGYWWCIAGGWLLSEATRILTPPRFLPMLQRSATDKDALRDIAMAEQVIQPALHQMDHRFFKSRVPVILHCSNEAPDLFTPHLHDDQWARILRRSPRWFADAKKSGKDGSC